MADVTVSPQAPGAQIGRTRIAPRLLPAFYTFVVAGSITATVVVWYVVLLYLGMFESTVYDKTAQNSTASLYYSLSRELDSATDTLTNLGDEIGAALPHYDGVVQNELHHNRFDWVVLVGPDGAVQETIGTFSATSATDRPWWAKAQESYVRHKSTASRAGALKAATGTTIADKTYIITVPVTDAQGKLVAVLAGGISSFFGQFLDGMFEVNALEAAIVGQGGRLLAQSAAFDGDHLGNTVPESNFTGASSRRGTDPDGETFVETVIKKPMGSSRDLFLITRYHLGYYGSLVTLLSGSILKGIALCSLFVFGAVYLFARLFLGPFSQLANSAKALLEGDQHYPYENASTMEASVLSQALATIQRQRRPAQGDAPADSA